MPVHRTGQRVPRPLRPIKHLLADGKSLYQTSDKTKAQDYTLRKILKQVCREQAEKPKE